MHTNVNIINKYINAQEGKTGKSTSNKGKNKI